MFEVVCVSFALFFGLLVRQVGLPPLVGFLAAGFAIYAASEPLGLPEETDAILDHVAHLGVLLLLFAVGLKLRLRQVLQLRVAGSAVGHFALWSSVLGAGFFLLGLAPEVALLLAMGLGFSSTVFSAKMLETKRELVTFHGRLTIGILIIQDLLALVVISVWSGQAPSWWALLVFLLPLLRPLAFKLLDMTGHDELLILVGMMLALVVGGMGFEAMGLSSELGALALGVLLSAHRRAPELSEALWGLKEVFLVGFFLQIGMSGLPDMGQLAYALGFVALLPLKAVLFFALLVAFGLRARNAFLSAVSLTAYSEFGLIVAAEVLPEWLVPLAIAVTISFVLAAPLNALSHALFQKLEATLSRLERPVAHPDELPVSLGNAEIIIFGMGRTGAAAYDTLRASSERLLGLDADSYRVAQMRAEGRNTALTDAEDANFWHGVNIGAVRAVILAMDDLGAKLAAARQLRGLGFSGPIIAHALYEDHRDRLSEAGADQVYLTMREAGTSLAIRTTAELERRGEDGGV